MRERGFTLIELMIAMLLGLILIGGAISVFISTKQGYRLQNGLTLTQATGRATLEFLSREIRMAGYPQMDSINAIVQTSTANGSGTSSDDFTVLYQSATDCLNNATPVYTNGKQYAKNMFFILNNALVCRTLAEDGSTIAQSAIVQGVENMQLLYGEDNVASDGITNATRYVTAGNVTNWNNVVSMRIAILVDSIADIATTDDETPFTLLGQAKIPAANDHLRRRAYSTTVTIRNRMQES